jgi:hypothetical protein
MTSLAYGNGLFVAVGGTDWFTRPGSDCVIQVSTNGTSWTTLPPISRGILRRIAFDRGTFVAVGESPLGLVLVSRNGVDWSSPDPGAGGLLDVASGNGTFVAVGRESMTSVDGAHWTEAWPPQSNLRSVAYGNGIFVAAGTFQTATSPDGMKWTDHYFTSHNFESVDFVGGTFLATSSGYVFASPDGVQWSPAPSIRYFGSGRTTFGKDTWLSVGNGGAILQSALASGGQSPVIHLLRGMVDGQFEFSITGHVQQSVRIDFSNDLLNWQPLTTLTLTNSPQGFRDGSAAGARQRFYRGVSVP